MARQYFGPVPQVPGQPDHAAPTPKGALMARIRKLIVAVLGLAATLVAAGVLDDQAEAVVTGLLALATAAGVWAAPNERAVGAAGHDPTLRA